MPKAQEKNFEKAIAELEEIVSSLETGEFTLDEALKQFEKGIALVRFLNQKLEQSETKVQKLLEQADGDFRLKEIDSDILSK